MAREAMAGQPMGSTTRRKMANSVPPSIRAASSRSRGMPTKKLRSRKMANGRPNATWKATTAGKLAVDAQLPEELRVGDDGHLDGYHDERDDDDEEPVPPRKVEPGQGVRGQRAERHDEQRGRHRDEHGVPQ